MKLKTLSILLIAGALLATSASAEVLLERTYLPFDAAPSSFAVGLPGGVSFCFDPARCAVSYAWTGGFVDISPIRPGMGKRVEPVKLLGPVVYREAGAAPLRRSEPWRPPTVEFKGYTLRDDSIEFRYLSDGALVREEIRVAPGGQGLVRRYRVDGVKAEKWQYVADGKSAATLTPEPGGALVADIVFERSAP
jgi:hypothetical protein